MPASPIEAPLDPGAGFTYEERLEYFLRRALRARRF